MEISAINRICPKASHVHRIANYQEKQSITINNPQLLTNTQFCLYCYPKKEHVLNNIIYCNQYRHQIIIKLTPEQIQALHQGFDKYEIPYELREIIFDYSTIIHIYHQFNTLHTKTLEHMLHCKECCPKLIDIISDNICPNHTMVRHNQHQDPDDIYLNLNLNI